MAYRFMQKFLVNSHILRKSNLTTKRMTHSNSDDFRIWPYQPLLERPSLFAPSIILKHYEVIPIIVLALGSLVVGQSYNLRNALTRDDVRYSSSGKMHCEIVEMDRKKPPRIRKFRVYNQKYSTPEGLIRALEDPNDSNDAKKKKK